MKIYNLTKPYLSKHRLAIITYLIISVFVGLFVMVNPFLIGDFIDSLIEGSSMSVAYRFAIIFAVVGYNGSGKTTLINLLLGIYIDERNGDIFYNGYSSEQLNMSDVRRNYIGLTEQESVILNESIFYNITFEEDKELICEEKSEIFQGFHTNFTIDEFAAELLANLKNKTSNPANFSGGEKQKLSILRLLIKNPDVMIFDEPSSSMDASSTERFSEYLQSIKRNKIIIIITHDSYIKNNCDVFIDLSVKNE